MSTIKHATSQYRESLDVAGAVGDIVELDVSHSKWAAIHYRAKTIASGAIKVKVAMVAPPTAETKVDDNEGASTTRRYYVPDPDDFNVGDIVDVGGDFTKLSAVDEGTATAASVESNKTQTWTIDGNNDHIELQINGIHHGGYADHGTLISAQKLRNDIQDVVGGDATVSIEDSAGNITALATYDSGNKTQVTSAGHGLKNGQQITIEGTGIAALDGIHHLVSNVATDTFVVDVAYSATAAGTWNRYAIKITAATGSGHDSQIVLIGDTTNAANFWNGVFGIAPGTYDGQAAQHYLECAASDAIAAVPADGTVIRKRLGSGDFVEFDSIGASKDEIEAITEPVHAVRFEFTGAAGSVDVCSAMQLYDCHDTLT